MAERRQQKRFAIQGKALAYYRTHSPKIAEVIDISSGGLALSYVGSAEVPNSSLELDIVFPDRTDYVEALPCKAVSDCKIEGSRKYCVRTRRCGIQFKELSGTQKAKIASLIENYCWRVRK